MLIKYFRSSDIYNDQRMTFTSPEILEAFEESSRAINSSNLEITRIIIKNIFDFIQSKFILE